MTTFLKTNGLVDTYIIQKRKSWWVRNASSRTKNNVERCDIGHHLYLLKYNSVSSRGVYEKLRYDVHYPWKYN